MKKPLKDVQSYIQAIDVGSRRMCFSSVLLLLVSHMKFWTAKAYLTILNILGLYLFPAPYHGKAEVKTVPYCFQASSRWTWFWSYLQAVLPADETVSFTSNDIQLAHTSATFGGITSNLASAHSSFLFLCFIFSSAVKLITP